MRPAIASLAFLLVLPVIGAAQSPADPDETRPVGRSQVAFWLPPSAAGPQPLILFSHGFGGCKDQSGFFLRALAQAGMVVAAPDHADQRCGQPFSPSLPAEFDDPAAWTDKTFADRRDQLRQLRMDLLADPALAGRVEPSRIALIGHSLGGYSVLAMGGARDSWQTSGIAAVVALAPYLDPYHDGGDPAAVDVPVLIEAGTLDRATRILPEFYAKLPSPACYVNYVDAGHFAWVDGADVPPDLAQPQYQAATILAATSFLTGVFAGTVPITLPAAPGTNGGCK